MPEVLESPSSSVTDRDVGHFKRGMLIGIIMGLILAVILERLASGLVTILMAILVATHMI